MIVVRPGETPPPETVAMALSAREGARATAKMVESLGCSRISALNLVLQSVLVEIGLIDVDAMCRLSTAVSSNVSAALLGDRRAVALDDIISICGELEAAAARKPA